jgi:AbrB family looped-hinge helix DNA binding protein
VNARISIDQAGRLVLPKQVRDQLQIEPGESLELETCEDHIVLRPARQKSSAYKKKGIWVFRAAGPLKGSVVDETIRKVRRERERQILGTKK